MGEEVTMLLAESAHPDFRDYASAVAYWVNAGWPARKARRQSVTAKWDSPSKYAAKTAVV